MQMFELEYWTEAPDKIKLSEEAPHSQETLSELVEYVFKLIESYNHSAIQVPQKRPRDYESVYWILENRAKQNYYFSVDQIKQELAILYSVKASQAASNQEKAQTANLLVKSSRKLNLFKNHFERLLKKDWEKAKLQLEGLAHIETTPIPRIIEYTQVNEYQSTSEHSSKKRLQTLKRGNCNGEHCTSFQTIGWLEPPNWNSQNSDRKRNTECSSSCRCSADQCANRGISTGSSLKLGQDLVEADTWGFDYRTRKFLKVYLMKNAPETFISKTLPKAINSQKSSDIRKALHFVVNSEVFTDQEKTAAKGLWNAIEALVSALGKTVLSYFQTHPKGRGVVCCRKQGIPKNCFITEHIGEIYSPAKWHEKETVLKKNKPSLSGSQCDFFNIRLETHLDDEEGKDVMFIDSTFKGNYGSRLKHSCNPNCGTVVMASEGRYTIAIYAIKDIDYLEELTFDFNSITDDLQEYQNSLCLCCAKNCRVRYMSFAANEEFMISQNFLESFGLVVQACETRFSRGLDEILRSHNIKDRILDGCPEWLKTWIALVIRDFIQQENSSDYREIMLNSLVIAVDKVKYFLQSVGEYHQPIQKLTREETVEYLWGDFRSLKLQLWTKYADNFPELSAILVDQTEDLAQIKLNLLKVRDVLRMQERKWETHGVADLLHFVAYTKNFFRAKGFSNFIADVPVRELELDPSSNSYVSRNFSETYRASYVLAVMTNWGKHSNIGTEQNFIAERRGTLVFPSIQRTKNFNYSGGFRTNLITNLRDRPNRRWYSEYFSWDNYYGNGIYGSPMLDVVYSSRNSLEVCLQYLDVQANKCRLTIPN